MHMYGSQKSVWSSTLISGTVGIAMHLWLLHCFCMQVLIHCPANEHIQ